MDNNELMQLKPSITNYILLRHAVEKNATAANNLEIYKKLIQDYWQYIPLFEIYELMAIARCHLKENDLEVLFNCIFTLHHNELGGKNE